MTGGRRRSSLLAAAWALATIAGLPAAAKERAPAPLFEDVSAEVGLLGERGARVLFHDLDRDGAPDAIIGCTKLLLNREVATNGRRGRRFVRWDADAPFNREGVRRASVVQVGDLDGDGRPDLYLGRSTDLSNDKLTDDGLRSEVWLQTDDGFELAREAGVGAHAETTISALLVDYDRDGRLDLFTGQAYVAYGRSLEAFPDRLYRGLGDGRFEDVTEEAGLLGIAAYGRPESRKPTYGVAHTDWNNDGLQDLLVMTYGRQWNRLWRNDGDGTFTDVAAETTFDGDADRSGVYPDIVRRRTEPPFRANGNTFDCAVADFDGDGDMDCFLAEITHWWAGSSSDLSMLLVNRGEEEGFRFARRPGLVPGRPRAERWNQGDLHAGWLDVDNDGLLDLAIASTDYPDEQILRVYHQRPDHTFEDWTDRLGFRWQNATQLSLGDYDRDGATDILLGTSHMRLTKEQRAERPLTVGLFRNRAPELFGNRFFSLRLVGAGAEEQSNPDAIGARVTIRIDGRRQVREVYGGQGHVGHRDDTELRFGVGRARTIDEVSVRWPDAGGTVQRFERVRTGRFYRLEQGGELQVVPAR